MPTREPRYYIRIFKDDDWFVLWRIAKAPKPPRACTPIWRRQGTLGTDVPHLYKTLVGARNTMDKLGPSDALMCTVAVWSGDNASR